MSSQQSRGELKDSAAAGLLQNIFENHMQTLACVDSHARLCVLVPKDDIFLLKYEKKLFLWSCQRETNGVTGEDEEYSETSPRL